MSWSGDGLCACVRRSACPSPAGVASRDQDPTGGARLPEEALWDFWLHVGWTALHVR